MILLFELHLSTRNFFRGFHRGVFSLYKFFVFGGGDEIQHVGGAEVISFNCFEARTP